MAKITVEIRAEWCKSCGLCVEACPKSVLGIDESILNAKGYSPAAVLRPEACVGCASCALMCPDSAIRITRD